MVSSMTVSDFLRLFMDVDSAVDDFQTIEDEKVYLRHLG